MRYKLAMTIMLASAPFGALACSCVPPGTVQQEITGSSRVFLGRVAAIKARPSQADKSWLSAVVEWTDQLFGANPPMKDRDLPYKQITFVVNQTFKGTPAPTVQLATGMGGGDCGYAFEAGQTYVVYARGKDDALEAGICSLTGPASDPRSGLAILRNGS